MPIYTIRLIQCNSNCEMWRWELLEKDYVIIEKSLDYQTYQEASEEAYSRFCFYTLEPEKIVLKSTIK